jgi:hypothetical protein
MHPRILAHGAAIGLLAIVLVGCGGGSSGDAESIVDVETTTAASTAADAAAVDPNELADAGAIIYDEEIPVPGTTLGACDILTPDDIRVALGLEAPVPAGTFEASPTVLSPGHSNCAYEGDYGRVLVSLTPEDGANLYDAAYGAYDGLEVIPGLGDGAFWAADTNRGFIWQDRVAVMLSVYPVERDAADADLIKALGTAIIGKL